MSSYRFWLCNDCGWSTFGTVQSAASHYDDPKAFTHWIYEFTERHKGMGNYNQPTGRSIHTSDHGGYYVDDLQPESIALSFMLKAVNSALRRYEEFDGRA